MTTTTQGLVFQPIEGMEPGSPEWLRVMSASKLAAILGLSPWESRFSLWHRMKGTVPPQAETDDMRRGHFLEPAVAQWFAHKHPEYAVKNACTFRRVDRPWQVATPDRQLIGTDGEYSFLECKTEAAHEWEWGPNGSDIIPIYYRVQVMWTLDTLGLDYAHVAVLLPFLEFREYRIDYDPDDAAFLRQAAVEFMDSLANNEEPDLDDTDHTYQAIRQLNPSVQDRDHELDDDLAAEYLAALIAADEATARKQHAVNKVMAAMGDARRAVYQKRTYANRQSRKGGNPYLVTGRGLIAKESIK